jgi:rRNA-processing protein FCF1
MIPDPRRQQPTTATAQIEAVVFHELRRLGRERGARAPATFSKNQAARLACAHELRALSDDDLEGGAS